MKKRSELLFQKTSILTLGNSRHIINKLTKQGKSKSQTKQTNKTAIEKKKRGKGMLTAIFVPLPNGPKTLDKSSRLISFKTCNNFSLVVFCSRFC